MTASVLSPEVRASGPTFDPLERLFETPPADSPGVTGVRGRTMPAGLRRAYGGTLEIPLREDRPTVVANFVSTLDGVVALDGDGSTGGGEISGFYEPDRFVMGAVRALADVVVVGAGTLRAAPKHQWVPGYVHPRSRDLFAAWRLAEGITAAQPTTMIVTSSGVIDGSHPGLSDPDIPVVIVTTPDGATRLRSAALGANVRVVADRTEDLAAAAVSVAARDLGARLVLSEGGPHLFGGLVASRSVDELFLTLAPQLVGRSADASRLALIEGVALAQDAAAWSRLVSVRRSVDHLFLRYRFTQSPVVPAKEF